MIDCLKYFYDEQQHSLQHRRQQAAADRNNISPEACCHALAYPFHGQPGDTLETTLQLVPKLCLMH